MDDLISRQAAIDALICKMRPHDNGDGTVTMYVMSERLVRETLNELPSAQPESKTGKWIFESEYYEAQTCRCSECGKKLTTKIGIRVPFCPWCGARMERRTDDEG